MSSKFEMFANRLVKNLRHTGKWARRQGITCYRVYDNDMPEFPLAVDIYEGFLHVAEYAREHGMDPDAHSEWLDACIETLSEVLGMPPGRIYLKFRERQKGLRQYQRFDRQGAEYVVQENGLKFIVNPADYLDTGLFLDHRNTRSMVRNLAQGKRVLNLFAYTGSFSVYAAAGGAESVHTVDMSNTYLQWAERNLGLNGFSGPKNTYLQTDVLQWLEEPVRDRWDLVVVDPPTFSNSKRMRDTLDIQRDHAMLLNKVLFRTAPGGTVLFSTNYRRFKLWEPEIRCEKIEDVSKKTVPEDFRNKKIHQCFLLQKHR